MPDPQPLEAAMPLRLTDYLRPPHGYFWHWAEENEVVEWLLGTTITYREELHALLAGLAPDGLPPLGAVLLTLAACTSAWQESSAEIGFLQGLLYNLPPGGPPDEELVFHLSVARAFLDTIRQLPAGLRTGTAKEQLLRVLLAEDSAPRQVPATLAPEVLNGLAKAEQLFMRFTVGPPLTRQQLRTDLLYFDRAAQRFPTVHSLELRLRTGLSELPQPPEELPTPPPPTEPSADLLAELAQDERTAGLARLVPHLRAALHLPHTARQAGEQPLGGVADIANRGPLDRLLLSELAQDDLSLLARLANGEALYLRREEPPLPQMPPRILLLDATLSMWGQPRVLGLAAALALAAPPGQAPAQAWALEQLTEQALDLRSRAGVVAALELLDAARHCGAALLLRLLSLPAQAEALLITEAESTRQLDFLSFLRQAPATLRFLLTVSRAGELVLSELVGGRRVELSCTKLDVEKLLFPARQRRLRTLEPLTPPAFLWQAAAPLRFPTGVFTPQYDPKRLVNAFATSSAGVLGIVPSQRLLYWRQANTGAVELLPLVEPGQYCFDAIGVGSTGVVYLLVCPPLKANQPSLLLYKLHLPEATASRLDLTPQLPAAYYWSSVHFKKGYFVLQGPMGTLLIDSRQESLEQVKSYPSLADTVEPFSTPPPGFLNTSHSVLHRLPRLGIDRHGLLTLGNWQLPASPAALQLHKAPAGVTLTQPATLSHGNYHLTGNPHIRFQRFCWPDGSEAIADGRGLLHLRSADTTLPEVTVVLAVHTNTAAWASDGQVTGWHYFTNQEGSAMPVAEFYSKYIQPFIDRILRGQPVASNPPG